MLENRLTLDLHMMEAFVREAMRPSEVEVTPSRRNIIDRMNLPFESVRRLYLDDRVDALPDWLHEILAVEADSSAAADFGTISAGESLDSSIAAQLETLLDEKFSAGEERVPIRIGNSVFHTAIESAGRDHGTPESMSVEMESMDEIFNSAEAGLLSAIEASHGRLLIQPIVKNIVEMFADLSNTRLSLLIGAKSPTKYPDNLVACAALDIFYNMLSKISDARRLTLDSSSASDLERMRDVAENNDEIVRMFSPREFAVDLVREMHKWVSDRATAKSIVTEYDNGTFSWFARNEFPASFTGIHISALYGNVTYDTISENLAAGFDILVGIFEDCLLDPQVLRVLISNGQDVRVRSVVDYIGALDNMGDGVESYAFNLDLGDGDVVSSATLNVSVVDADKPVEVYGNSTRLGQMPIVGDMESVSESFTIDSSELDGETTFVVSTRPAHGMARLASAGLAITSYSTESLVGTGSASIGLFVPEQFYGNQTIELDTITLGDVANGYTLVSATLEISATDVDEGARIYLNNTLLGTIPQTGNLETDDLSFQVSPQVVNHSGQKNIVRIEVLNSKRWILVRSARLVVDYNINTKIGEATRSAVGQYHQGEYTYGEDLKFRGGDVVAIPNIQVPSNYLLAECGMRVTLYDADEREYIYVNGTEVQYARNPDLSGSSVVDRVYTFVTIGNLPASGGYPEGVSALPTSTMKISGNELRVRTSSSSRYAAIVRIEVVNKYDIVNVVSKQATSTWTQNLDGLTIPTPEDYANAASTIAISELSGKIATQASLSAEIQNPATGQTPEVLFNGVSLGVPTLTSSSSNRSTFTIAVAEDLVRESNSLYVQTDYDNVVLPVYSATLDVSTMTIPATRTYSWENTSPFDNEVEYYPEAGEGAFALVIERIFHKVYSALGMKGTGLDLIPSVDLDAGFRLLSDTSISSNDMNFRTTYDFTGYLNRVLSSNVELSENTRKLLSMVDDNSDYAARYSHMSEQWSLCPFRGGMYSKDGEPWNCPYALDDSSAALEICTFSWDSSSDGAEIPVTCPVYASFVSRDEPNPSESDAAKYLCSLFRVDGNGNLDYMEDSSLAVIPSGAVASDSSSAAYISYMDERHAPMKVAALTPIIDLCKDLYKVNHEIAITEPFVKINVPWSDSSSAALLYQTENEYGIYLSESEFFSFEPLSIYRFTNFHARNLTGGGSGATFMYTDNSSAAASLEPVNRDVMLAGSPRFQTFNPDEVASGVVEPTVLNINYLESKENSGWIDSYVKISENTRVVLYAAFTDVTNGVFVGQDGDCSFKIGINNGKWCAEICGMEIVSSVDADNEMHRFELNAEGSVFSVDSVEYFPQDQQVPDFSAYDHTWPVFALRDANGQASSVSGVRLYALWIWDGTNCTREFIPVKIGVRGYLYDFISEKFFAEKDANV